MRRWLSCCVVFQARTAAVVGDVIEGKREGPMCERRRGAAK